MRQSGLIFGDNREERGAYEAPSVRDWQLVKFI